MTETRKKLSLRIGGATPEQREADVACVLTRAMDHHLCVRWTYNRALMQAAPQILYRRNGGLYCDAVVTEKNGAKPDEARLASFKLSGLGHVVLTTETLLPFGRLDLSDARYKGGIVAKL